MNIGIKKPLLTALTVTMALGACSDDEASLLPCPPKGLGVEEFDGVSAIKQMENWRDYSCSEPQICPDEGIAFIGGPYIISTGADPAQVTSLVRNCSTGNKKLVIDKVVLYGDDRCSFTCSSRIADGSKKCPVDADEKEIDPGATAFIMTLYKPTAPGEDHAQFRVFSNAQNFNGTENPLNIGMCSRAQLPAQGDAGADAPDGGVPDEGSGEQLVCAPSAKINTTCHED